MNLRFLNSLLRYTIALMVVGFFVTLNGCKDDEGPSIFDGTVTAYIQSDEFKQSVNGDPATSLDSLVKYLTLYPDLTALLSGSAEYTLFAPSNTAFVNLITGTPGFPQNISLINPDIIKGVLAYHIVEGRNLKASFTSGATFSTQFVDPSVPGAAQIITINSDGTLKTGATNQSIQIAAADKQSTNGVVHIVASVMIPPSTGASLTPILNTMAGTVLLGKSFTTLAKLISIADAGFTENSGTLTFKIVTWLAMPIATANTPTANTSGVTFFAIPNDYVAAAGGEAAFLGAFNATSARALLLNHLALGRHTVAATSGSTTITNGGTIQSLAGVNLTTLTGTTPGPTNPYGVVVTSPSSPVSQAPIAVKDLGTVSTDGIANGVIQVVLGTLKQP